jgi:UDP-glucose 4-epimerase
MRVLVTGGAGYIGSATVQSLIANNHDVEILDNFSTGHRGALADVPLHQGTLLDSDFLNKVFMKPFDAVIHFAAFSLVGESVTDPLKYYHNNVAGSLNLIKSIANGGAGRFVFSSTAAVYGEPEQMPIVESTPTVPVNPYGRTKLAIEYCLSDASTATEFPAVALRYFNAAGAVPGLGEDHNPETHLIPRLLRSLIDDKVSFKIFGNDYDTPDGTCIRDYIHIVDLADAHIRAIEAIDNNGLTQINLGTGDGLSVQEIVDCASKVTGFEIDPEIVARRAGDPPRLVAANDRAKSLLGWSPENSSPERIISDAWHWHSNNPDGYNDRA